MVQDREMEKRLAALEKVAHPPRSSKIIRIDDESQREEILKKGYNFYGNVGAVQTGANALANVVQKLSEGDKTALIPVGILLP
jgi:hypothetical protein